jgi:hypothetical protein
MEHHIVTHIRKNIEEAKSRIENLKRAIRYLGTKDPITLSRELIDGLRKVRNEEILPLKSEFDKLLRREELSHLQPILYRITLHLDNIESILRVISTRHIPGQTNVYGAVNELLDNCSGLTLYLEKLHTFIDFNVEKNTIKLIKETLSRMNNFVFSIKQHQQTLISGYRSINLNNINETAEWVIKLERFRHEIIEPFEDKIESFFNRELAEELKEYLQIILQNIKDIEQIYKLPPVGTAGIEEKYGRDVIQHLDIIEFNLGKIEKFVHKYIE